MVIGSELDGWGPIRALEDATADELWTISRALAIAGGVFSVFAEPLADLAVSRGDDREPDAVTELGMRRALRRCRLLLEQDEGAMARLEAAEEPFWSAVRDALAV